MYFDAQDVVGESCGTQLDVDMLATAPFPMVPRPSFLAPLSAAAAASPLAGATADAALDLNEDADELCTPTKKATRRRRGADDANAERDDDDSPTMALMEPESLAALSIVVPLSQQDAENGSLNANAMQRLHLQTPRQDDDESCDEGEESFVSETPCATTKKTRKRSGVKRPRSGTSSPASSSSSSSTCASAVVLARKRALKESWRTRHVTKVPRQENALVVDDDDDEVLAAPRITSFVEYDAADIDDLIITSSQDYFDDPYDAEEEDSDKDDKKRDGENVDDDDDSANQNTQQQQPCGFVDFRDLTQFNEECSEVFDDVIYAPKPPLAAMPPIREQDRRSRSRSPPAATATSSKSESPAMQENINSIQVEREVQNAGSESPLSGGFDIPSTVEADEAPVPAIPTRVDPPPPPPRCPAAPQWNERRSVKRDCTFIETQCPSPVSEVEDDDDDSDFNVLLVSPRTEKCRRRTTSRIEELKADCIDSSDDFEEPASSTKLRSGITTSSPARRSTTSSPAPSPGIRTPLSFQPRLLKKRRKARQLGLEAFFRSRPCT